MPASDWEDMMPDELTCTPGSTDEWGAWTASGTVITPKCRIEGERRMVRDAAGVEVVSSLSAIVSTTVALTVDSYRYTLPSRFPEPRTSIEALAVDLVADEDGAHHVEIYFP